MYSDMSKRMSALSLPNRKFASAGASSVLPTPVGPRKTKLPTGRFGFFRPGRGRRIARDRAGVAGSEKARAAARRVRVLQAGARTANRARQCRDRLFLRDDALVQRVFHVQQL